MSSSVSVILPACNLQYVLRERVHQILDFLIELTDEFELLIVDYGSRDETAEVATELSRAFPQVRFLERSGCERVDAVIDGGIRQTSGQIIFVHDATLPFSANSMRRLWSMRDDDELVIARSQAHHVLAEHGSRSTPRRECALQMIRRSAIQNLMAKTVPAEMATVERFTRTDLVRHSREDTMNPNLVARLQRLVSG